MQSRLSIARLSATRLLQDRRRERPPATFLEAISRTSIPHFGNRDRVTSLQRRGPRAADVIPRSQSRMADPHGTYARPCRSCRCGIKRHACDIVTRVSASVVAISVAPSLIATCSSAISTPRP